MIFPAEVIDKMKEDLLNPKGKKGKGKGGKKGKK